MIGYANVPQSFELHSLRGIDNTVALGITIEDTTWVFSKSQAVTLIKALQIAVPFLTFEFEEDATIEDGMAANDLSVH